MDTDLIPIRLRIVIARPGARGDFVAGWLGTLPDSVDTQWRLDVDTGRSMGLMNCFKEIDSVDYGSSTLDKLLAFRQYKISMDAPYCFNMVCHGNGFLNKIENSSRFKIIHIIDNTNQEKINWEYVVKTFFSKERFENSVKTGVHYNVDKQQDVRSNCQRQDIVREFASRLHQNNSDIDLSDLDVITCEYQNLFEIGGSHYLCKRLGIQASGRHHQLWDKSLELANSISCYDQFDRLWTYQDYWK